MRVASVSKSFTATAVMQLVDDGKVDLDQPVRSYLPEFTLDDPRVEGITVRQLLNHTSGMADSSFPNEYRPGPDTLKEAVERLGTVGMATDPGSTWAYHNPNYHVAARLVEVVSHEPFAGYLNDHILDPLGMDSTVA